MILAKTLILIIYSPTAATTRSGLERDGLDRRPELVYLGRKQKK